MRLDAWFGLLIDFKDDMKLDDWFSSIINCREDG